MYQYLALILFFSNHLLCGAQQEFTPFLDKHETWDITVYDKGFFYFLRVVTMQIHCNARYEYKAFYSINPYKNPQEVEWLQATPKEAFDYFSTLEKEYRSKKTVNVRRKKTETKCIDI